MKVRALRGVCVGVDHHLVAGDVVDLDAAQVPFLVSIKAVEVVPDEVSKAVKTKTKSTPPEIASDVPDFKE